jgi:putative restriction endonuclease
MQEKFDAITVWKRGGERAPRKPLFALYALGRALRGEPRTVDYARSIKDLGKLLIEFGPAQANLTIPISILAPASDGLWELSDTRDLVSDLGKRLLN